MLNSYLPANSKRIIFYAIDGLARFPDSQNTKRLTNHNYDYRLRVGRYRVLFNYDGEINIVAIMEVKKRDEQTY
ncbi:MAG: hypothetical protein B6I37_08110 [Desulfobacteraceae bacterium 4572_35.2]|nr:MAG: hypothetical protein B6I37_08110 [Desulfobacteraceae bacterium 4572_35.2]